MATGAVPLLPGLPGEGAAVTKAAIYTVKLTLPEWQQLSSALIRTFR
jgi:hypothetical protein